MKGVTLRAYVATNWNTVTTVFDIYTKPGEPGSGRFRSIWARVRVDNNGGPAHNVDVPLTPAFVAALRPKSEVGHNTTRLSDDLVLQAFHDAHEEYRISELRRRRDNLQAQALAAPGREAKVRLAAKVVMIEQVLEDFFGVTS